MKNGKETNDGMVAQTHDRHWRLESVSPHLLCFVWSVARAKRRIDLNKPWSRRSDREKVGKVKVSRQTQGRIENILGKDEKEGDVTWLFRKRRKVGWIPGGRRTDIAKLGLVLQIRTKHLEIKGLVPGL
jgi:hypothetical protein